MNTEEKNVPARIIRPLTFLAISLIGLTACEPGDDIDTCDSVYRPEYRLADCQKAVGNFKKGNSTHYVHSEGFEFDLNVIYDSTFTSNWSDYCVVAEQENRTVMLTSTYPIMSIEVNFYGGTEVSKSENFLHYTLSHDMPMLISHGSTSFYFELDSAGNPRETIIDDAVRMLDTITFNGVTYDSVFVIMDQAHSNAIRDNEKIYSEPAHLYFSKSKGILKLTTTEGRNFTIKEGSDDE